jgi:hypothetical protein
MVAYQRLRYTGSNHSDCSSKRHHGRAVAAGIDVLRQLDTQAHSSGGKSQGDAGRPSSPEVHNRHDSASCQAGEAGTATALKNR